MHVALGDSAAPPLVEILHERMGSEAQDRAQLKESKITAVFDKYKKLETTTFAFFKLDSFDYLLHFHLESHDRCIVKLKPLLWDKGAYFRPELLSDGALRLIPHFTPIQDRNGAPRKRRLSSPAATDGIIATPRPQRRSTEITLPPSSPPTLNVSEIPTIVDDEELVEQETFEDMIKHSAPKSRAPQQYYHGTFNPRGTTALPRDATYTNWVTDFAAAKQRYFDGHLGGNTPASRSAQDRNAIMKAHRELMLGKYGMAALKPCKHCVRDGVVCRVYHTDCYNWQPITTGPVMLLGWRCVQCRVRHGSVRGQLGGCDANHEV